MLSSLREDYPLDTDDDPASYEPPLFAAVFSLHTSSPSLPTSAHNASALPDFKPANGHGWHDSIKKEIDRVVSFKAMAVVTPVEYTRFRKQYSSCPVSIGNFVLAFRIKTDPDGDLLEDSRYRKSRLTLRP